MKMDVIKKFIDEYKTKQSIYEDFAKNVGSFLEILLENNEFRYQAVFSRGKELSSLQKKITENEKLQKLKTVTEVDDLAGCRVIFYLDNDIERFRNHIYKEFNIVRDNLKYSEDKYNARHMIVKLNK